MNEPNLWRRIWPYFAIFLGSGFVIWMALLNDDQQDQYTFLLIGERVLHGQVPYRDFFTFVPPGTAFTIAAWFKTFGDSMEGVRVLTALTGAATVTLAFDLSREVASGPLLWIGPLGALSAFVVGNQGISHVLFAIPLAMTASAVALRADRSGSTRAWFAAGLLAASAGLFTQTVGAWMGLAIFIASLTTQAPLRRRALLGATVVLSGGMVLVPMLLLLLTAGAWDSFRYDVLTWTLDRYAPYHAGVGWGAWLPGWSMLTVIPGRWWPVWIPTIGFATIAIWVLPFVPVIALLRSVRGERAPGRRVLLLVCAAMYASALPNGEVWRVLRLSAVFWPLIALELQQLAGGLSLSAPARERFGMVLAVAIAAPLLACLGVQWSYRGALTPVDTPRGHVLIHPSTRSEFEALRRHYQPGEAIVTLPDVSPADYLFRVRRTISNDYTLAPVFMTPSQLQQYAAELRDQRTARIAIMPNHATNADVIAEFKPGKYLDEFNVNALDDFVRKNYDVQFVDDGLVGLIRKP